MPDSTGTARSCCFPIALPRPVRAQIHSSAVETRRSVRSHARSSTENAVSGVADSGAAQLGSNSHAVIDFLLVALRLIDERNDDAVARRRCADHGDAAKWEYCLSIVVPSKKEVHAAAIAAARGLSSASANAISSAIACGYLLIQYGIVGF